MYPTLISAQQATEYGYSLETYGVCYIAHVILERNGVPFRWKEGIATPDENDEGDRTDKWRVQLFFDGEKSFLSSKVKLKDAIRMIDDWTKINESDNYLLPTDTPPFDPQI